MYKLGININNYFKIKYMHNNNEHCNNHENMKKCNLKYYKTIECIHGDSTRCNRVWLLASNVVFFSDSY